MAMGERMKLMEIPEDLVPAVEEMIQRWSARIPVTVERVLEKLRIIGADARPRQLYESRDRRWWGITYTPYFDVPADVAKAAIATGLLRLSFPRAPDAAFYQMKEIEDPGPSSQAAKAAKKRYFKTPETLAAAQQRMQAARDKRRGKRADG